jgi:hypothetical protein
LLTDITRVLDLDVCYCDVAAVGRVVHHNNKHQDLKTRVISVNSKNKGNKKRETFHLSSAQEVCTTTRGHECKQCGTITPESTYSVLRVIILHANNITRNNVL